MAVITNQQYTTTVAGVEYKLPVYYTDLVAIASGSYGHVCRATDTRTGNHMAIKKVSWNPSTHGVDYSKRLLREVRLMIHFHMHDNLLNLQDLVTPTSCTYNALYLVSQYIKTDLHTLLSKCPKHFTEDNCLSMIYSMLSGLFAMHSAGVMHRDLKPSNILIDGDGTVKLADFGLGRDVPQSVSDELTNYVVTRWYRAPEVLLGERYGMVVDVWSLGCIMAEMLTAGNGVVKRNEQILFPSRWQQRGAGQGTKEQINMLLDFVGHTPGTTDAWVVAKVPREWLRKQTPREPALLQEKFPEAVPDALSLLKDMLTWNPNERPSVRQCLRHNYLGDYAWSDGNEDDDWPIFDGSFAQKCKTEEDASLLANLEITRFHPEFAGLPGIEIMDDVPLKTSAENGSMDEFYVDSDQSVSGLYNAEK